MSVIEERYWAKVNKGDTCWIWMAYRNPLGYGTFRTGGTGTTPMLAHRFGYELAHGPIPSGMQIDHICHVPACVNPAHLRLATDKQNKENHSGPRCDSTTGRRGVHFHKPSGLWTAIVTHNKKRHSCGYFKTADEAEAAVIAKRNELHEFNDLDRRTHAHV